MLHTVSLTFAFLLITVLHIVLGEQAPKSFAIRKPEPTSLWIAFPLYAFYKVTYPVIWLLNHAANGVLRMFGIMPATESELRHSEEEIRQLLDSEQQSELPDQKRELLANVFELSHRSARQIMVPRADVVYLSTTHSMEENMEIARRAGHTRFPLCEGDLDHVVGLVHIKDLFRATEPPSSLTEVKRAISFVPETLPADRMLRRMRAERVHMAAVLDEYGGVNGIVTLENVIEEIVGEIQDEFDFEKPEITPLGAQRLPGVGPDAGGGSRGRARSRALRARRGHHRRRRALRAGTARAGGRRGAHRPPGAAGPGDRRQPHPHAAAHVEVPKEVAPAAGGAK